MKSEKRTPNFTLAEKEVLIGIVQKYAFILEDKKINRVTVEEKNKVWEKIEEQFNTVAPIACFRSGEQLRRLYENKKKELRKKLADNRKETFLTGGGPPPDVKFDPFEEILLSIVNEKTVQGLDVCFDSDASEPLAKKLRKNDSETHVLEFEFLPTVLDPTIKDLNVPVNEQSNEDETEERISQLDIKKKCPRRQFQMPLSKELRETLEPTPSASNATPHRTTKTIPKGKLEDCQMTSSPSSSEIKEKYILGSSRRRPTSSIKTLTSSDVSEKYNVLLDKRLVLVGKQIEQAQEMQNFSREEHKEKIKVLQLEQETKSFEKEEKKLKVEVLRIELMNKKSSHSYLEI